MTTLRKIQANRANARASTGPKTAPGRARAARNARRHGLSLSVFADPTQSEQVETLAREIAGEPTSDGIYQLARRVAEAQIDLQRVRCARHQFLSGQLANPYCYSLARFREQFSSSATFCGPTRRTFRWPFCRSIWTQHHRKGRSSSQQFCWTRPNSYKLWTVTSGGRYHAEGLPFARSIVHALRPTLDKSPYTASGNIAL